MTFLGERTRDDKVVFRGNKSGQTVAEDIECRVVSWAVGQEVKIICKEQNKRTCELLLPDADHYI